VIRLLLLDLGETLIHDGVPFPQVPEALAALSRFRTADGQRLAMGLVSDFGEPSTSEEVVVEKERQFAQILRDANLDPFFMPFETHVTISARASAFKPDQRVFETAARRSGLDATLAECLFITENPAHLAAARDFPMAILGFGDGLTGMASFSRWTDAPVMIAERVAPQDLSNWERSIAVALDASGEVRGFKCHSRDGETFRGQAAKLLQLQNPDLGEFAGLFVEVPVDITIHCSQTGAIDALDVGEIAPDDEEEATNYVQSLARRGLIGTSSSALPKGATHAVEVDGAGRRLLIRQRFSK